MKNKNILIGGLAILIVIIFASTLMNGNSKQDEVVDEALINQEVIAGDPLDIVLDFYKAWLNAATYPESSPYKEGLATTSYLSERLSERLLASEAITDEVDPVICQEPFPERVNSRITTQTEDIMRVLVLSRDKSKTAQSTFLLRAHKDGWYIDDIECSLGEFPPEREFTFEKEGFLLKSVPPPLDATKWHIIFDKDGEPGHFVPLSFADGSTCASANGDQNLCEPDTFSEPLKAKIYGQMTELGVDVEKVEFIE